MCPKLRRLIALAWLAAFLITPCVTSAAPAPGQYAGWPQSGSIWLLTTPEGADIPAGVVVKDFPVLVRLSSASFDFIKAQLPDQKIR